MRATRKWFVRELRAANIVVHDTNANFVLVETESPSLLAASLALRGVRVRDLSWMDRLERYLRITVTTRGQMARALQALVSVMHGNLHQPGAETIPTTDAIPSTSGEGGPRLHL
jgi:histidinol-phosphate/aromatic aminotransferase/cobyric acid decarboxylase-like protein